MTSIFSRRDNIISIGGDLPTSTVGLGNARPSCLARFAQNKLRMMLVVGAIAAVLVILLLRSAFSAPAAVATRHGARAADRPEELYGFDRYSFAVIADMDKKSLIDGRATWRSILKLGSLARRSDGTYSVTWDDEIELKSQMNEGGRGMELSELVEYNGMLLTCDDRTGIIFEIIGRKTVVPRFILSNGDGDKDKGFKCEWMTVKDGELIVGSTGKEWTTPTGALLNHDPLYIKRIDANGHVEHVDWSREYNALRAAANADFPGYMIHEAVTYHPGLRQWFVLPRRVSQEAYDDVADERRGANLVLRTSDFVDVKVAEYGPQVPSHGFSSVKFLPNRPTEFVALKSEEDGERIATYITVFDLDGSILLPETEVGNVKFEGVEFLRVGSTGTSSK